jgi:hypothetical protein
MTITEVTESLSAKADRHLWGDFARHGAGITPPTITRGEGVTILGRQGQKLHRRDYHAWPRRACLIGQIGLVPALLDLAGFRSADWSYRERTSATGPAESAAPPDRTSGPEIMRFATERLAETVVGRTIYLSHRR